MRIRTLVIIILIVVLTLLFSLMLDINKDVLGMEFVLWRSVDRILTTTVGAMLIISLASGMLITFLLGIARQAGLILERRRLRKESRKQEEIEEEYSRGLVALLEGREEEALGHFRAVLERDSRHFNTLLKLGQVLRIQGKHAEAVEYHRKAHHLKEEDTRPLYALVEDYEAKGDMDHARAVLGKIIALQKQSISAWRKLRSLHMKERNWSQALEAHEKAEKLSGSGNGGDTPEKRIGRGIRYEIASEHLDEGRSKEAMAVLRRILKDDPQFLPAHVKLGEALQAQGQDAEAQQTWYRGFEITGSPIILRVLEEYFLQREEPMGAIEALKRCISQSRKDTLGKFYLGKLYFRLEMLDDAYEVLSDLEGRASYAPSLHYLLGRIHERRKHHKEAGIEYRKVIKEMDLVQLEYRCRACDETIMEWTARCPSCERWNCVEVNFREEISLDELGLSPAPIYE
jgi:lipopolysaccharide biosynthesis regulator YciM